MRKSLIHLMSMGVAGLLAIGSQSAEAGPLLDVITQIEHETGGRVGLALAQTGHDLTARYRPGERFPMSSTFKVLVCGAVLSKVDNGKEHLGRLISYTASELVTYSPVTELNVSKGMTVGALCEAAITMSDNTAGNLLLNVIGGPEALTDFLREIGDTESRLDRYETDLNEGVPGDARDTTTPNAILGTLDKLVFGSILGSKSREQLEAWMRADKVADALIRSSLPKGWQIGDKTGAGGHGSRGIIAVIRPTKGLPWLAAIYMTGSDADMRTRDAAIAKIGAKLIDRIVEEQ